MKRKIKTMVTVVLSTVLAFSQGISSFASTNENQFTIYETKLAELNAELGTNYELTPTEGSSYDEMVSYFTDMTLTEFEIYIREAYDAEQNFNKTISLPTESIISNSNISRSTLQKQKYYYAGNSNYLCIDAYTTTVSGSTVYTGDVASAGGSLVSYPGYKAMSYTKSFSSDMKTVAVSYKCMKYLSKNVTSATYYTVNVTFTAGGGDVYPLL